MHDMITDYLVIGSGIAGLRAAVELARHGKVIVATKDIPTESNTEYAQGGVAVALSDEDRVGIHFEDTINAVTVCAMRLRSGCWCRRDLTGFSK